MTWDQVLVWIVVPLVGSILIGGGAVMAGAARREYHRLSAPFVT